MTAVLFTGLFTGLMDGLAAILQYTLNGGKNPANIFKFIASGLFGKEAFTGGTMMVAWGIVFHFLIAFLFTLLFFLAFPKIEWLRQNKILGGILYGVVIWAIMNLLVVPLSNTPPVPFQPLKALVAAMILIVCVGLPVSLLANKYYLYKK